MKKEYLNTFKVGWFLATRQIKRSGKGVTALIIFIMVLTFLNLVVVSGLLIGLIVGSYDQYKKAYSGEVIITSAPYKEYIEGSPELVNFLKNHPRVISFSPRYGINGTILGTLTRLPDKDKRANQIGARVVGIDPLAEEQVTNFSRFIIKGENLDPNTEGEMLIGATFLKKYSQFADADIPGLDLLENVDVGSRVRLTISSGGAPVVKDFYVKGVVKSKVDEISTRMFILDKELKRMLAINQEQLQSIAIRTDSKYASALVVEIKNFQGDKEARVQTSEDAIPSFLRDIETTMRVLGNVLSSFALIVATITIFIVIFINAVTKKKFIGIMKGIGISPSAVQISYIIQAFFYGVTGSAIGTILTFGFLKPYFAENPIDFPFSDGILVATPESAALRIFILMLVTLIAGYIPAKIIIRKNTLNAILGR